MRTPGMCSHVLRCFLRCSVRLLMLLLALSPSLVHASTSVTATKTSTTTTPATFTLATAQVVEWDANYMGSGGDGNDFYLNQNPANLTQIPLSTNLVSGNNTGTVFLNAGTYSISITYFGMGPGSYSITYNRTASIGVAPSTHSFGNQLQGVTTAPFAFTISKTGDLDVTIANVVSSDPAHFQVSSIPTGQTVGSNKTFQVKFVAGTTTGPFGANITTTGTATGATVNPVVVSVSGTTIPNVPNISCPGTPTIGSADWSIGQTKVLSRSFQNTGTASLTLSSITLANDTAANIFSLSGAPSLAALGAGGTRSVSIQFAPVAETTYSGHLIINSNDPDTPVAICPFTATGHHPVPKMRLDSTLLDYHQVELGFSFTKGIFIFNDGDAPLTGTVTNISLANPDLPQWSSLATGGFTVNPGTTPAIFKEVFTPLTVGTRTIQLQVTSNDLTNSLQNVTLTGEGIPPIPIDSVLVLDRSGSMADLSGPVRKIDALQTAADMWVHLLRPDTGSGLGDKIGLVRFNDTNDVYLPLNFMTPTDAAGTQLAQAEDKLSPAAASDTSRIGPTGATWIGGAMQTAAGMYPLPANNRKHVMVVLTDGKENRTPGIMDVVSPIRSADPALKMYAIGLGTDVDFDKLQAITNITGGYHQVSDDLSGISRFDLETFYFKIFSNANAMDLVVDPTSVINLSGLTPVVVSTAHITSSDRSATFLVLDVPALRAYYNLELEDPHGQIIVLGSTVGGSTVQQIQRYDYSIYRVVFPDVSQASTYVGDWILRLTPNGKTYSPTLTSTRANPNPGFFNGNPGMVPVGFVAAVQSDYHMDVALLPSTSLPGADVKMTATLTDRGWPSSGTALVDVKTPGGTDYVGIPLFDDGTHGDAVAGDGIYTNHFQQTSESGSYRFFFHAIGKNDRGEMAPREATRYATLMQPSKDPPPTPCIPCRLLWVFWIVVIIILIWLIWWVRQLLAARRVN